jgi:RNA polymerase sigma-70 factor (ECF subfamily)
VTAPPLHPAPAALRDLPVAELLARARSGCRASYGEVVARFEQRLFNFLLRRAGNPADAEDLTQETFIRAWQRLAQYDGRWQFSTWLFTIGARLAISRLRSERARRAATVGGAGPDVAEPRGSDAAQAAADREQCALVWDLADRMLSETQRSALWLRYAEDLPPRAIARILGKSQIGVRVMLFRARETLAEACGDRRRVRAGPATAPPRDQALNPTPVARKPVPGGAS